jgi:hypothetical protein
VSHPPPVEGHWAPSGGGGGDVSSIDLDLNPRIPVERSTIATSLPEASDPKGKCIWEDEHKVEEPATSVPAPLRHHGCDRSTHLLTMERILLHAALTTTCK